jgi:hypothetical protein
MMEVIRSPETSIYFRHSTRHHIPDDRTLVCFGIKNPSGVYNQIFITVRQLQDCWRRSLSLTRGRVYHLQLLLALDSAVILGSESHHISMSQIRDFPFRRLLRLAGSRWRYSTPSPHGFVLVITSRHWPHRKHFSVVACIFVVLPSRCLETVAVYSPYLSVFA